MLYPLVQDVQPGTGHVLDYFGSDATLDIRRYFECHSQLFLVQNEQTGMVCMIPCELQTPMCLGSAFTTS